MTYHEQGFTKRPTALPQNIVGIERDDVAKREDERVDVFHVQVVRGDGVRDGV